MNRLKFIYTLLATFFVSWKSRGAIKWHMEKWDFPPYNNRLLPIVNTISDVKNRHWFETGKICGTNGIRISPYFYDWGKSRDWLKLKLEGGDAIFGSVCTQGHIEELYKQRETQIEDSIRSMSSEDGIEYLNKCRDGVVSPEFYERVLSHIHDQTLQVSSNNP